MYKLGDGSLYTKLQRKLQEAMLARYHHWVFENNKEESVIALRTWMLQEAEFQTIASETVRGLTGKLVNTSSSRPARYGNQQTFFGEFKNIRKQKWLCQECGRQHGIWNCQDFLYKKVAERRNTAKRLQLCFRCLAEGHQGKLCPRSRQCGQGGCEKLHHRLLHKPGNAKAKSNSLENTELKSTVTMAVENALLNMDKQSRNRASSFTEGKKQTEQTTMVTQSYTKPFLFGISTVPVLLTNAHRSVQINALLDDANTKTYVNADVAAELGLQGRTEKVTVNVLNGQVETFEIKPISVELKSITGDVSMIVNAYTVNRVKGEHARN